MTYDDDQHSPGPRAQGARDARETAPGAGLVTRIVGRTPWGPLLAGGLLVLWAAPAAAQPRDGFVDVLDPDPDRARSPRLTFDRARAYAALLARARAEGASADHLAYLDRGLEGSPFRDDVARTPERLGRGREGAREAAARPGDAPFPARGARPRLEAGLDFLHPDVQQACLIVGRVDDDGRLVARWSGRRALEPDQCWSATKHLQALHVASRLGTVAPEVALDATRLRDAAGRTLETARLLREIVSYEAGVGRSNAGAATLGALSPRAGREAWNERHTGNDHDFRGNYGLAPLLAAPTLVGPDGRVLLRAPASEGPAGPNLVSVYDLARLTATAAWHRLVAQEARLEGAQARGVEPVLRALGHDPARYVEVALDALGVTARVREVAIASKLGYGVRSATGLPEIAWVVAATLDDARTAPPVRRRFVLALRATGRDPVALDARVAAEVTEVLRRVLDEEP